MATQSDEHKRSLEIAVSEYELHLEEALPYLESRGIGRDTALSRRLGFVRNPTTEHRKMSGRLCIPYLTRAGVVAISFRCIEDHNCSAVSNHGKYRNPAGQLSRMYGVEALFSKSLDIGLTEGEINAITASDECGIPTVGVGGADKWQPWWAHVLDDFRRVYVFQDGDEGGRQFVAKVVKEMGKIDAASKVVPVSCPAREDVNSLYVKTSKEEIRRMVYGNP